MDTNWHPHCKNKPSTEAEWFSATLNLARYLRSPEGCPWDRKQTAQSFAAFIQEEAQEVMEAFEKKDDGHIAEELGDTLFCILASIAAAEEEGRFKMEEVLGAIHEKMIRRHEHVFGEVKAGTPEEVLESWNRIKAQEKEKE
jgi:tetrapyrrole methylase family protein/MazG family protein